jgi:pimeloyl-ACP methyl ester carboxylesterase
MTLSRLFNARRQLSLLLLGLLASGCVYRPGPTTVPMRTLEISGGSAESRCLVVFLPGRGDTPEHFVRNGFPEKLRRAGSHCTIRGVDSHLGYFFDKSIVERLREDVIAPARAEGFEEIWLVGISLGGFGSLLYTKEHPGEIAGIVAIASYLGEPEEFPDFWTWLDGYNPDVGTPLFLAYGKRDRFAEVNGQLADRLPDDRVFRVRGRHTWATWRRAWDAFLASELVPGRTTTPQAPAPTYSGRTGSPRAGS